MRTLPARYRLAFQSGPQNLSNCPHGAFKSLNLLTSPVSRIAADGVGVDANGQKKPIQIATSTWKSLTKEHRQQKQ